MYSSLSEETVSQRTCWRVRTTEDKRRWKIVVHSGVGRNLWWKGFSLPIRGLEERRQLPSRQRILEYLRSNLTCFGNIFKWLLSDYLFFTMYIKYFFRRANGGFNPPPLATPLWKEYTQHRGIYVADTISLLYTLMYINITRFGYIQWHTAIQTTLL